MSESRSPQFSIVIPSYERFMRLDRCLSEIFATTVERDRYEVIVVDDGSRDPRYAELRNRTDLHYVRRANGGPASARNHGARIARGDFLVFTDDDCCPDQNWLGALARNVSPQRPCAIAGVTRNGLPDNLFSEASQLVVDSLQLFHRRRPGQNFFTTSNVALSRREFLALGGFDESYRRASGEDRDLLLRWQAEGWPVRLAEDVVVYHYHSLRLVSFVKNHFENGRSSARIRKFASRSGGSTFLPDLSFYRQFFRASSRDIGQSWVKMTIIKGLLFCSQVCVGFGFVAESILHSMSKAHRAPAG